MAPQIHGARSAWFGEAQSQMDLRAHLVTLPANGRAQVEMDVLRQAPELIPQKLDPPFQDSGNRTTPSGMEESNDPFPRIHEKHGRTIRHRHPQQDPL